MRCYVAARCRGMQHTWQHSRICHGLQLMPDVQLAEPACDVQHKAEPAAAFQVQHPVGPLPSALSYSNADPLQDC